MSGHHGEQKRVGMWDRLQLGAGYCKKMCYRANENLLPRAQYELVAVKGSWSFGQVWL
jgi:hypothetical protein